nr:ribosomal protein L36 [Klebsormidium crenulatum]YP_010932879.1 ribosomal protein L36 [Klebsormidium mucosum]WKT06453.1 ribosomal protein L36 [Klebsormidium crenulatum]WKT07206.1 ribosomal protein L36 [Klebsormidium mucosum]
MVLCTNPKHKQRQG